MGYYKLFYRKDPNQFLCSVKCRNRYVSQNRGNIETKSKKPKRKYRGSQKGENNNGAKLDVETVRLIRRLRKEGKTYRVISEAIDVSPTTVKNVALEISWKEIK